MTDITSKSIHSVENAFASNAESKRTDLNQQDFLKLLLTQIRHQDPLSPMESSDFFSQLAQVGTVNGINALQSSFEGLSSSLQSSQALHASMLVGRSVLIPADTVTLDQQTNTASGAVDLTNSSGALALSISDATGKLVRQIDLGAHAKGLAYFVWDGLDNSGNRVVSGDYKIAAQARLEGKAVAQDVLSFSKVKSVNLNQEKGDLSLNLAGQNGLSLSSVREIK